MLPQKKHRLMTLPYTGTVDILSKVDFGCEDPSLEVKRERQLEWMKSNGLIKPNVASIINTPK